MKIDKRKGLKNICVKCNACNSSFFYHLTVCPALKFMVQFLVSTSLIFAHVERLCGVEVYRLLMEFDSSLYTRIHNAFKPLSHGIVGISIII